MSWWSDLFGGGDSRTDGVNFPDWYTDPHFSGSQDFLDQYSRDLLNNGPNDYYRPIGEYGTPEFFNFINQAHAGTQRGVDEALARSGRARGGRAGEVAAQSIGDSNTRLIYEDYLRAMKGREMFFQTGLGTQRDVRNAGFANQSARNNFNIAGANFDYNKAIYGDQFDRQSSEDIGKTIGTIAPIAGAGLGFVLGGPSGAMTGYNLVNSAFGSEASQSPQWLDMVTASRGGNYGSRSSDELAGISNIGRINSSNSDELMKLLASIRN